MGTFLYWHKLNLGLRAQNVLERHSEGGGGGGGEGEQRLKENVG